MSRILWLSNGPWCPSGYGQQTALFLPRLRDAGHELAVLCNYGLQGRETMWDDFVCYPSDGLWGNTSLATFVERFEADQVVALCDAWVLQPDKWPDGLEAAVWAPVDHYPIPPIVVGALRHERIRPVAMSRFGEQMMRDVELDPLYVPHAVDTGLFRPEPGAREQVRDELGIPQDVCLAGMVAANTSTPVPRKAFPQAFLGFSRFARRHDDAWLYVHAQAQRPAGQGIMLDTLAEASGCPQGRVRFPHDQAWQIGMSHRTLAAIYQALDVLLMPSMGEGFGIPLVEAQACGVPVIASDHSAMTELAEAGWLVSGDPWWDEAASSFLIVPAVGGIDAALEAAYESRGDQALRDRAVEFAASYDADHVTDRYWLPALEQLADREAVAA